MDNKITRKSDTWLGIRGITGTCQRNYRNISRELQEHIKGITGIYQGDYRNMSEYI